MSLPNPVIVSGGAGYIGSHVVQALRMQGFSPLVIDSLVSGNAWAAGKANLFHRGDIADAALVRHLCRTYRPVAALHFAAFIEVGESVADPVKYFHNNRDKARAFFDVLAEEGVRRVVFSSTAAVYGEGRGYLDEDCPVRPINPYGQSKLEAETYLRSLSGVSSCTLRYFNVAGALPEAGLGEAHFPESHLIPRLVLSLIPLPQALRQALGLAQGFRIFGDSYATPDGTAIRDYVHVLDLADAHVRALRYLLGGGDSAIFNLGSGNGYSVRQIVDAARATLAAHQFNPPVGPARAGDPPVLVASSDRAHTMLGWKPVRRISDMIASAAAWHRGERYLAAMMDRACARV